MKCPKCKEERSQLFLTTWGTLCRPCKAEALTLIPPIDTNSIRENSRDSRPVSDPEYQLQRDANLHGEGAFFALFSLFVILVVFPIDWLLERPVFIKRWFTWKSVCAWCGNWSGGNPFARHTTHGICPKCFAQETSGARQQSRRVEEPNVSAAVASPNSWGCEWVPGENR